MSSRKFLKSALFQASAPVAEGFGSHSLSIRLMQPNESTGGRWKSRRAADLAARCGWRLSAVDECGARDAVARLKLFGGHNPPRGIFAIVPRAYQDRVADKLHKLGLVGSYKKENRSLVWGRPAGLGMFFAFPQAIAADPV